MKHNSKKRRASKKRGKMKTPFTITIIILILFVVLIIFSIFKGPVEKNELNKETNDNNIIIEQPSEESSSVKANKAIVSEDINKCEGDKKCEFSFVFAKALKSGNLEDCNEAGDLDLINNCKDNVLISKAVGTEDKSYCAQIQDLSIKTKCEEL